MKDLVLKLSTYREKKIWGYVNFEPRSNRHQKHFFSWKKEHMELGARVAFLLPSLSATTIISTFLIEIKNMGEKIREPAIYRKKSMFFV